ncbi:hypothetical protein WJX82_000520 [Trebouxia sp. C0006]
MVGQSMSAYTVAVNQFLKNKKPYLLRGKTEQFFDPHYQLAVFGHNEDEYPFAEMMQVLKKNRPKARSAEVARVTETSRTAALVSGAAMAASALVSMQSPQSTYPAILADAELWTSPDSTQVMEHSGMRQLRPRPGSARLNKTWLGQYLTLNTYKQLQWLYANWTQQLWFPAQTLLLVMPFKKWKS